jgi:suppressor of fused
MDDTEQAPGWDAIDAALQGVYGDQTPLHYGTVLKYAVGGSDPVDGISIYKNLSPSPHWHSVTYGFSELYAKESEDPEWSGFGFELTFRLACSADESEPPAWPMNLLQNLARYVFRTGNPFDPGHHMNANGPIALGTGTELAALLFCLDPQLGEINTPHGRLKFVQVVGITLDELDLVQEWSSEGLLQVLSADNPLLITDLERKSLLADPQTAALIRERAEREGSSTDTLYIRHLTWKTSGTGEGRTVQVSLGAQGVDSLVRVLPARILHGRELEVCGQGQVVRFEPAGTAAWRVEGDALIVEISPELMDEIQDSLRPQAGEYGWPALTGLTLQVVPSEIRDPQGKVIRVVG